MGSRWFLGWALLAAAAQAAEPPLRLGGGTDAEILWSRTFASAGDDWINDLVSLRGGRYLAVGFLNRNDAAPASSNDWRALAASFGDDGSIAWTRNYGAGEGIDALWSAVELPGGGLAFAGFTTRIGAGGIDALALFAAADGTAPREQAFGESGYDRFTDVAPAGDGLVFLGHSQPAGETRRRVLAVRTAADGRPLWERIIEGPESLGALYIEPAGDGGFVVAGGIERAGQSDLLVLRLDRDGRELWRTIVGTPEADDVNHGLVVLPGGRIVIVGYSRSWGARDNAVLAASLSPSGEVLRQELLDGPGDDRPILAKADAQGRVWIVGETRSAGAGGSDGLVARLGASGRFEPGVLTFGSPSDERGTAILPLADDSFLVAGYSQALGGGGQDAFVMRISPHGWGTGHPAFARRSVP